jgi:hypothetical protein
VNRPPGSRQIPANSPGRITLAPAPGWPRLGEPSVRHRGQYCYVAALLPGHREPIPILRLRYQGSADDWAIGIYKASTGQYSCISGRCLRGHLIAAPSP